MLPDFSVTPPGASACCGSRRSATSATCCRWCARCRTRGPRRELTWIIGKLEHKLLGHLPGIEFVVFDKKAGRAAYSGLRERHGRAPLRRAAAHAARDPRQPRGGAGAGAGQGRLRPGARPRAAVAVHQRAASCRTSASTCSTACSASPSGSACASARCAGTSRCRTSALDYARRAIPDGQPTLVVSPCSSHALRNWSAASYAAVADHAVRPPRAARAALRRPQRARTRDRPAHRALDAASPAST